MKEIQTPGGLPEAYFDYQNIHPALQAPDVACQPTADLRTNKFLGYDNYAGLNDQRALFVGAGAGSVALACYLSQRGMSPENMTFIDRQSRPGGMWNQEFAREGYFNNPRPLDVDGYPYLYSDERDGRDVASFINDICDYYLEERAPIVNGQVTDARRSRDGIWRATTEMGESHEADYLVLGTGAPHPRKINGRRIHSNLDDIAGYIPESDIKIERHQRKLTDEEFALGRPLVLLGLGNSTATMRGYTTKSRSHMFLHSWATSGIVRCFGL